MPWIFRPDLIRRTRERLGLSATRFAHGLDTPMSGVQIIDIETGRRGLTVATLLRICNQYELRPATFFQHLDQDFTSHEAESSAAPEDSRSKPRPRGSQKSTNTRAMGPNRAVEPPADESALTEESAAAEGNKPPIPTKVITLHPGIAGPRSSRTKASLSGCEADDGRSAQGEKDRRS